MANYLYKAKLRIVTYIFILILLTLCTYHQIEADTLENLSYTVVLLHSSKSNGTLMVGTGFFLQTDLFSYIVTAEHVAKTLTTQSQITIRTKDGKSLTFLLTDLVQNKEGDNWPAHKEADIALLPLKQDKLLTEQFNNRFLPISLILKDKAAPIRVAALTVIGFPLGLPLTINADDPFSPISKETKPASDLLTLLRFDTKKPARFFLTQDPSIGGFSGAPIFDTGLPLQIDNTMYFRPSMPLVVGLVHGTLSDDTGGKMGAIVPSYYILEAIEQFEEQFKPQKNP
ncbi:MAG TPA: S1 family peptidase [Candidatus Wunengus sp. YC60]|uniref:S1 family peptidase n=1 Tax=Candidatus Wunengus sp. YC60 TaxID=3367697 RepID=UPI004028A3C5